MRFLVLLLLLPLVSCIGEDDLVTDLPGLIFDANFKIYSGYLSANADASWQMFYLLYTSRGNPDTDPLILFLNGGPGCSSTNMAFSVTGPIFVNHGARQADTPKTLFENVYGWNQRANLLFLDSPVGVGFSYDRNQLNVSKCNDDLAALQNYGALNDFFGRVQPKYANRPFFISGESYAGVYLPTLADNLVKGINANNFSNPNFQGVAIGNGFMDTRTQVSSLVVWMNYHAQIDPDDWEAIKRECCNNTDVDKCMFIDHFITPNGLKYFSDNTTCGNLTAFWVSENLYNLYQDCYDLTDDQWQQDRPPANALVSGNHADLLNIDTTDSNFGYYCWAGGVKLKWLREQEVMKALHISDEWLARKQEVQSCNDPMYSNWNVTSRTTMPNFMNVLRDTPNFRVLSYNGDVDNVCNYIGNAQFMRQVAGATNPPMPAQRHARWHFRGAVGGGVQRFKAPNGNFIDVLSVKGAGHNAPLDRPGPALQMITNFMANPANFADDAPGFYSVSSTIDTRPTPRPLKANSVTSTASVISTVTSTTTSTVATTAANNVTSVPTSSSTTVTPTTTGQPGLYQASRCFGLAMLMCLVR